MMPKESKEKEWKINRASVVSRETEDFYPSAVITTAKDLHLQGCDYQRCLTTTSANTIAYSEEGIHLCLMVNKAENKMERAG